MNGYTRYECTTIDIEISFLFLLCFLIVLLVRHICHYLLHLLFL